MKIACIFITCNRLDLTLQCIKQNFYNSGYDADVIWIDNNSDPKFKETISKAYNFTQSFSFSENKGISHAINKGIELASGYDAVVTLANDILMPDNWLKAMVEAATRIQNTGMAGIHCVEGLGSLNELNVHPTFTAFGNVLIPRKAIDTIGFFNTDYDPYGTQDADYAYRLNATGFINYYLPYLRSTHIGHDVGNGTAYRRMKDESLNKAAAIYSANTKSYDLKKDYYIASN